MEKQPRKLVLGATPIICFILFPMLYAEYLSSNATAFDRWMQHLSSWSVNLNTRVADEGIERQDFLQTMFQRLVRGKDRAQLDATGFGCDNAAQSVVCVARKPVRIDTSNMTVYMPSSDLNRNQNHCVVRPYARKTDVDLMKRITPVTIIHGDITAPPCQYTHDSPATIFSTGGYAGNLFHAFDEIIIPAFLTARHFQSRVQFIAVDYRSYVVHKHKTFFSGLSPYQVMNAAENASVHCFPGAVVGLRFHNFLAVNSSEIPGDYSISHFRSFLRNVYNLKIKDVNEIEGPVLLFISRPRSRMFLNEREMARMMREVGFKVIIIRRPDKMSKMENFSRVVNSCKVMVAAHGAGITNQLFLPDGAVTVQVVPWGLQWASTKYFGEPAKGMGLHYLEYKIEAEESSLFDLYGRDHPVIKDPLSIFAKGYQVAKEVYIDAQNLKINVGRFRDTIVEAFNVVVEGSSL